MSPLILLLAGALALSEDDLETTVSRMAMIGSSSSPSFSPDGRRVAFLSNLSGVPQVWIVLSDGKRLGVMGGSYGGYMVMAALAEYPETFAAGANLFGVVNFETFFAHTEPWMASISKVEYGDPATDAEMLRRLSPFHKIDRVRTPTLVLHGANDTNVPVVEADQVVENLKRRGVPVEYVLFPDEGHGFRKTPNRIRSTVAIVRWFEKYLKS